MIRTFFCCSFPKQNMLYAWEITRIEIIDEN